MEQKNNSNFLQDFEDVYLTDVSPVLGSLDFLQKSLILLKGLILVCSIVTPITIFYCVHTNQGNIFALFVMFVLFWLSIFAGIPLLDKNETEIKKYKDQILTAILPFFLEDGEIVSNPYIDYSRYNSTHNSNRNDSPSFSEMHQKYKEFRHALKTRNKNIPITQFEKKAVFGFQFLFGWIYGGMLLAIFYSLKHICGLFLTFLIMLTVTLVLFRLLRMLGLEHRISMLKYGIFNFWDSICGVDEHFQGKHNDTKVDFQEYETVSGRKILLLSLLQKKRRLINFSLRNRQDKFTKLKGNRIQLESPEFNRIYEVASNKQIGLRYILSPAFMERLICLHRRGITLSCCFENSYIYIAIKTKKDLFEISTKNTDNPKKNFLNMVNDIKEVLSIIDILEQDLNK